MPAPAFHWFLPSAGDGREVGAVTARQHRTAASVQRPATVEYLGQIARAAEHSGFAAALTPTGAACEDPLVLCAALAQHTTSLQFLVAFRPSSWHPTCAAHQAATFQRITGGRLRLNVVTGGDPLEQRSFGDLLTHDDRYSRTDEFMAVFRHMWDGEPFDHHGSHYEVEAGQLRLDAPRPPLYFGGASPAAERVAARRADVYLSWGELPGAVAERIDRIRTLADQAGREIRFGVRLHVISRDTTHEAWLESDRLLDAMDPVAIADAQARFARMDSVAQAAMTALHGGSRDALFVAPNLWAGIGLVREGAATALVGSHEEVAERLDEYHRLGCDEFVLSGYPHLEEAYRVGECVLPLVAAGVAVG